MSFSNYGKDAGGPTFGAIGVIDWKRDGKGHVGIVVGMHKGKVVLLGGNQGGRRFGGGAVNLSEYSLSSFSAFRLPTGVRPMPMDSDLPEGVPDAAGSFGATR
ncbi:MAG: hypothetical protein MK135_09855 [Polyangiaceae bacterium]|nr:hypothetical protein [Polyangiaceae bacterium]